MPLLSMLLYTLSDIPDLPAALSLKITPILESKDSSLEAYDLALRFYSYPK